MPQSHQTTDPVWLLTPVRFLAHTTECRNHRNFTAMQFSWSHQAMGPVGLDLDLHLYLYPINHRIPHHTGPAQHTTTCSIPHGSHRGFPWGVCGPGKAIKPEQVMSLVYVHLGSSFVQLIIFQNCQDMPNMCSSSHYYYHLIGNMKQWPSLGVTPWNNGKCRSSCYTLMTLLSDWYICSTIKY